jgi:hypothetical protein
MTIFSAIFLNIYYTPSPVFAEHSAKIILCFLATSEAVYNDIFFRAASRSALFPHNAITKLSLSLLLLLIISLIQ